MKKRYKFNFKFNLLLAMISIITLFFCINTYIVTYSEYVSGFTTQSGIINNIVYVNDAKNDYYYYMGLNYTNNSGSLPTVENKNIYNENNLVEVSAVYSGLDIEGINHGYVSLTERQDTYIYYKNYPVNNNGTTSLTDDYILIELIDNPFTDRPSDKGFNGWITDYENVLITYDSNEYVRYAKVPVTYVNNKPELIEIEFYAKWYDAKVNTVSDYGSISAAIGGLDSVGMNQIGGEVPQYEDVTQYYISNSVSWRNYYPTGAVNNNGSNIGGNRCNSWYGCTYYIHPENSEYNSNVIYYSFINGSMSEYDVQIIGYITLPGLDEDTLLAGYYREISIPYDGSLIGYYDNFGVYQTSGNCTQSGGCTYYELIQYYDNNGDPELAIDETVYYYLVTRDMNIVFLNTTVSGNLGTNDDKPFTLTSVHNGTNYINTYYWNVGTSTYYCYSDARIENIRIYSSTQKTTTELVPGESGSTLYGRWNNLKLGRGIIAYGSNYVSLASVVGGTTGSTGSYNNIVKYRLIIESGFYNSLGLSTGSSGGTNYINGIGIYGNDYDRVNNNNTLLDVRHCASGGWSGTINGANTNDVVLYTIVKSGQFGSNKYDYATGIYVGGRNAGTHNAVRQAKIEGGYVYNLIGGPLSNSNRTSINDIYIYMTGGVVEMITGGAGRSATYGNRIISVTGGTVNYSVFGGSNGYLGSSSEGTLNGIPYIYIGGDATIGDSAYVSSSSTLYGAEAGSVFGIGNGRVEYPSVGSANNSVILINDESIINRNVYAGGNYGAVGVSSNASTTYSIINIYGGLVKGNIYGGGNNNGSGNSSKVSTININMTGGRVKGSIYGGSNQLGTIYGNTNINIIGGVIETSVYGGGQGGYASSSSTGTFVSGNSNVIIGDTSAQTTPVVNSNVYGGSAFGTVNGATQTTTLSSSNTSVTINKGIIDGSIFGGGEGNATYTPYVEGNVGVVINGGTINNVFGGNDAAGTPNGYVKVYLNGGNVQNTYGGGNQTGVDVTNVYLQGGNSVNIFGGSNLSGNVTYSNIISTSGVAGTIYGGNNQGGITTTSNITVDGANITTIYGGGKLATTGTTYVTLNASSITSVYGGGESADITNNTNVYLRGSNVGTMYGGSNVVGSVPISNITTTSGVAGTIYGGNNQGGITTTSNITVDGASITTIYGGGKLATTGTTYVTLNASSITSVYGGGESADITNNTNIYLRGSNVGTMYGGSNVVGSVPVSNITTTSGVAGTIYGGNNQGGITTTSNITVDGANITTIYGGGNEADTNVSNVTINSPSSNITNIYGGGNAADVSSSNVNLHGGTVNQVFGGSNQAGVVASSNILVDQLVQSVSISTLYGGNNQGGTTTSSNIDINGGTIGSVYGGGNVANTGHTVVDINSATITNEIYGGGNQAGVLNSTDVNVINSTIQSNIFGGGNAGVVEGNTDLYISGANVSGSVYAGGNGITAVVKGNTVLNIDGQTVISGHAFGGGNAAPTGIEHTTTSNSTVNIAGGIILGNVYGGANTSVINGFANVNIGINAVSVNNLNSGNINIQGTVFGGGEANAGGSQIFDWNFISVTEGINVLIDASAHTNFDIGASIFGSGNASSSAGTSYVTIKNYGTINDYKKNVSIQRATYVTIDNSAIELEGIADRTNELFSDIPFTIARVNELKLKNNSVLFLQTNTNLLNAFTSVVDVYNNNTGQFEEQIATVTIDEETREISSNVDNRLYIWESKNVNILLDIAGNSYGKVTGMTFFGMFNHDRDGNVVMGMYDPSYNENSLISTNTLSYFSDGAYVMGLHATNHNIKIDGFYTNYENEDNPEHISVNYINPTALGENCYKWVVGAPVLAYEIEDLKASKYSTLGTAELPLIDFSAPNTKFYIEGFAYNELDPTISLIDPSQIPRIASSTTIADTVMSLVMESSNVGWITSGTTVFKTDGNLPSGVREYDSENSNVVPTLLFYLYHSKNLSSTARLGKVKISVKVETPINEISSTFTDLNIIVNLSRALINTNDYEGTITAGKKYELFANTATNVTTKSSISTYFSLYAENTNNFYAAGYHHVLISNYVLPENTKITMIDYGNSSLPEYYYYVVSAVDVQTAQTEYNLYGEASYKLSKFVRMGSSSVDNHYDDAVANNNYYNSTSGVAEEEFIFIVDYSESNITENKANLYFLMELRNASSQVLVGVLAQQQNIMSYNLYYNSDGVIDVVGSLSTNPVYIGKQTTLNISTNFVQRTTINDLTIYDTFYFEQQLGIKLSIFDAHGIQVNGADLLGVTFKYNNVIYYPRLDGTVRFNLAERVANVSSNIVINTLNSNLASGQYTIIVESFASPDGIYYGLVSSDSTTINLDVVDTIYGLKVTSNENSVIVNKDTGMLLNNNNAVVVNVECSSGLNNPNVRISLYRRNYSSINNNIYNLVDLKDFVTNTYLTTNVEYQYMLLDNPPASVNNYFYLKPGLMTGTYKLVFSLYDGNTYIGDVYKYLIIK